MIAGKSYKGIDVDIWSCGVILYALICGYLPFEDQNTSVLYNKILNGDYTFPLFITTKAKEFLTGILTTDPKKRFGIKKIREHPWFTKYKVD